jgi:hypothetical protein
MSIAFVRFGWIFLFTTPREFLTLLKETTGATIIPSPSVGHSLSELLHQINGTSPSRDRGQEDGSSTTVNAAQATAAAAANTIAELKKTPLGGS